MPNLIAYLALIIWPFLALFMYRALRPVAATFWTIVGGYLLLPVRVSLDFPLIPPLDKQSIPAIAALIGCMALKDKKINLIPKSGLERWLIFILLLVPFFTVLNNGEPMFNGYRILPGLTYHDALSSVIGEYIRLIPFILGLQLIKTHEDQLELFKLLVIAALWYSLLILFEIRMSPQLHTWIYGFFPHSFGQQYRFGGFRAVVFMGHGLIVAMFVALSLGAATILWRNNIKVYGLPPYVIVIYFFLLLILSKTVGAFLLGTILMVAIAWVPVRIMKRMTLFIMLIVILYPLLSIFDIFPHQGLVDLAAKFDLDRAQSLAFRFFHENRLLQHAQEKLFFGWGGWNRNRLAGSVTDGYWIITLGLYGIIGFAALFGLAGLSVRYGIKSSRMAAGKLQQRLLMGHALIVTMIMVDQLPNASLSSWLWLMIGALMGRARYVLREARAKNMSCSVAKPAYRRAIGASL